MPHLARRIDLHAKHRNQQPRTTPGDSLQNPNIANVKFRAIQRHLPALPPRNPRLLANVRHDCRKRNTLYSTHHIGSARNASISRLLPTQNGVR